MKASGDVVITLTDVSPSGGMDSYGSGRNSRVTGRHTIVAKDLTPTKLTAGIRDMMNSSSTIRSYSKQKDFTWCNLINNRDMYGLKTVMGISAKLAAESITRAREVIEINSLAVLKERGVKVA
jgi:hypothetical protein